MCGIAGIVGRSGVNQQLYDALTVLQHRGQDAAGIVTCDHGRVQAAQGQRPGARRVPQRAHGAPERHLRHRPRALSHRGQRRAPALAQPFYVNSPYGICLAHNGNLTNSVELREQVFQADLRHINTDSDSEVLLNVFAHELQILGKLVPDAERHLHRGRRRAPARAWRLRGARADRGTTASWPSATPTASVR